jgi:hypothetical protein
MDVAWRILACLPRSLLLHRQAGLRADPKTAFDPDLAQGGNTESLRDATRLRETRRAFSSSAGGPPVRPRRYRI